MCLYTYHTSPQPVVLGLHCRLFAVLNKIRHIDGELQHVNGLIGKAHSNYVRLLTDTIIVLLCIYICSCYTVMMVIL
jgi:hypothetical protein